MIRRVAVITPASANRSAHLHRQREFLRTVGAPRSEAGRASDVEIEVEHIEAWLDADEPAASDLSVQLHVPPGPYGLRVGAGRNAAARLAQSRGADLLVFLDVDCLPGPTLLERYVAASADHPDEILNGPVTYLASPQRPDSPSDLAAMTRPHPARPRPRDGETAAATSAQYDLFWSLSFAVTPAVWDRLGGFDEAYEGYGAEDTDLGRRARSLGIGMRWVGGAHAYHQWHPSGSPPWRHLDDILRNGAVFAERWGEWPMGGWLRAFLDAGAIEPVDGGFRRVPAGS